MANAIFFVALFSQIVMAAPPCEVEEAALKSAHQQLDMAAKAVAALATQAQAIDQRIRQAQGNPAERQMLMSQSAMANGRKAKTLETEAKLKEKEQAAKLALTKCLNDAAKKKN